MQFIIEELEYQEALLIVTGKTSVGTLKGIWKDIREPLIGTIYHIELSISNPKEVKVCCENSVPTVYLDNENIVFVGLCEDSDNEVYYLRFAIDWLDMLDIDAITFVKEGDYISFSTNWHNIGIYPYDL